MKEHIAKQVLEREFFTDERCFIAEVSNSAKDPDASIARVRVGAHCHAVVGSCHVSLGR